MASTAMLLDDPLPDVIPLSSAEKARFAELESVVQAHLETFLAVGKALAEIRSRRLYRQQFATFEDYCTQRWGFSAHHGARILRSIVVARHLLEGPADPKNGDCPLPENVSETLLRPLSSLEPSLQRSVWQLANKVSSHPTPRVLRGIVKVIRHAIDRGKGDSRASQPSREVAGNLGQEVLRDLP
jgi:hypothetical protein